MEEELYRRIKIFIHEKVHIDNIPVLKILISEDDSVPALYDCQAKRRVCDQIQSQRYMLIIFFLVHIMNSFKNHRSISMC